MIGLYFHNFTSSLNYIDFLNSLFYDRVGLDPLQKTTTVLLYTRI